MTVNTLKVRLQHDEIYSKHFFKDSYCMPCPGSNLVTRNSHSKVWENEIRIKFLSVCSLTSAQSYCSKFRLTRSRRLHCFYAKAAAFIWLPTLGNFQHFQIWAQIYQSGSLSRGAYIIGPFLRKKFADLLLRRDQLRAHGFRLASTL